MGIAMSPPSRTPKKASKPVKYCKAPQAPKRFKSAFIFFTMDRHKVIRKKVEEDKGNKGNGDMTPDVAKLVTKEWHNLGREERAVWDEKARLDKERYEVEKSMYTGPWKIPVTAKRKSRKDPSAPKRPMSSFLSFSNSKRKALKQQNPGLSNGELSRLLADMWRNAPEEEKRGHIEREERLRGIYKVEISAWREQKKREEDENRERREEVAKCIVANRAQDEQYLGAQGEQYLGFGGLPLHPPPYHPLQGAMLCGHNGHPSLPYGAPHMYSSYLPVQPQTRNEDEEKIPQPTPLGNFSSLPGGGSGYFQPPPHYPGQGGVGEQGSHLLNAASAPPSSPCLLHRHGENVVDVMVAEGAPIIQQQETSQGVVTAAMAMQNMIHNVLTPNAPQAPPQQQETSQGMVSAAIAMQNMINNVPRPNAPQAPP